MLWLMDPLHATIEEFAAEGYTHVECFCRRCRVIKMRPMDWLARISLGTERCGGSTVSSLICGEV